MRRQATAHAPDRGRIARAHNGLQSDFLPLALAIGISVLLGIPTLLFPFGPDQAIFAYIAHRMSLGGFPYVAAWDQKPPAIYLLYLIGIHFPGPMMRNVRLFDLSMLCLTVSALFLLGRLLWGRWAGGLAGLLYGVAYTTEYGYWHTAQPDGYTALPLALALWLYYRSLAGRRAYPYLVAGALTGFAFQLRFFSALIGLGLLYVEWHARNAQRPRSWLPAVRRLVWFSAGFLAMQALFAAYLVAGHALGQYLFTEFRFATGYAHLGGPYSPDGFRWNLYIYAARDSTEYFLSTHTLLSAPAAVAVFLAIRRGGDQRIREIAVFALTVYLGVLIQAKFFLYHWLAVLPFVALLGGEGLRALWTTLAAQRRALNALPALLAVLALLLVLSPQVTDHAIQQWQGVRQYYAGPVARSAFNNQFGPYAGGTFSYLADDQVARYVSARTQTGDTIYVYGYEALVYLIAGRESASRFFYIFPVISTWSPSAWRTELYADLDAKRPRYILVQANEGAPWITGLHEDTAHYAAHDAALQQLLGDRYVMETQIEDFSVYRLKD
jgi:hypothetical protein